MISKTGLSALSSSKHCAGGPRYFSKAGKKGIWTGKKERKLSSCTEEITMYEEKS